MQRRAALWVLLGILVLGIGLRSYQLTVRSLWFDEAFSWRLIQFPLTEEITRTAADVHPPLYYFIVKGWSAVFGDSILALRSFSVTMAGLAIILTYCFASTAWNRRAGLLAAGFMALSAWQIPYAWEIRMYMLGVVLTLLSTWLLLQAMRKSSGWLWMGYILSLTAFLYVHNFAILTLLAHIVWIVGSIIYRTQGRFGEIISEKITWISLGSFLAILVLYLPWLPILIRQTQRVQGNFWIPPLDRWSLPETLYHFLWPTSHSLAHSGFGLLLTLLPLLGIVFLFFILLISRRRNDAAWLVALAFAIPIAGSVLISLISQSVFQERYLIFAQCWLLIAAAAVLARLPRRFMFFAAGLVYLCLGWVVFSHWRELNLPAHPGLRAAIQQVTSARKAEEPLFVTSSFIFLPTVFYEGKDLAAPDAAKLVSDTQNLSLFAGGPVILPQEIVSPEDLKKSSAPSLWVIDTTGFGEKENDLAPFWRREERLTFSELYPYQGDIIVSHWLRRP